MENKEFKPFFTVLLRLLTTKTGHCPKPSTNSSHVYRKATFDKVLPPVLVDSSMSADIVLSNNSNL